ncbi:MAG: hypothetical protein R6V10_05070 [bacterium]
MSDISKEEISEPHAPAHAQGGVEPASDHPPAVLAEVCSQIQLEALAFEQLIGDAEASESNGV